VEFPKDFFDQLSMSAPVKAAVDEMTEAIADTARQTAPEDTGEYRDGITTASKLQKRYVGLVIASDPKSLLIESKTGNLARAARANTKRGRRG
jgi:hypothetical protein